MKELSHRSRMRGKIKHNIANVTSINGQVKRFPNFSKASKSWLLCSKSRPNLASNQLRSIS